jgi:hypothetical protein
VQFACLFGGLADLLDVSPPANAKGPQSIAPAIAMMANLNCFISDA